MLFHIYRLENYIHSSYPHVILLIFMNSIVIHMQREKHVNETYDWVMWYLCASNQIMIYIILLIEKDLDVDFLSNFISLATDDTIEFVDVSSKN